VDISSTKSFLGLSLRKNQFCLIEVNDGYIQTIGSKELVQPLNFHAFESADNILDIQADILKELYLSFGIKTKEIGVVLSGDMVLIKRISVALAMEEEMIKEQLKWEANQFCISPVEEFSMDYQRLPFQTPTGNAIYLLVLVRKKVIEVVSSLVEKVGLVLKDIDVDIFSNIRTLLNNYDINEDEVSVLVDIHRDDIVFIFIHQREYLLSHRISFLESNLKPVMINSETIVKLLLKELRQLTVYLRNYRPTYQYLLSWLILSKGYQFLLKFQNHQSLLIFLGNLFHH
jgi:Tfp pilus assembly PilM family ATPase